MTASVRLVLVFLVHILHNVRAVAGALESSEGVKSAVDFSADSVIDSTAESVADASMEASADDSIDDSVEWGRRRRRWSWSRRRVFHRRRVWKVYKIRKVTKYLKAAKKWKKLKVKKLKMWKKLGALKLKNMKKHAKSTAIKWYKGKKAQYKKWYKQKKAKYVKQIKKFMHWKKRLAKLKNFKGKWRKFKTAKIAKWKAKWGKLKKSHIKKWKSKFAKYKLKFKKWKKKLAKYQNQFQRTTATTMEASVDDSIDDSRIFGRRRDATTTTTTTIHKVTKVTMMGPVGGPGTMDQSRFRGKPWSDGIMMEGIHEIRMASGRAIEAIQVEYLIAKPYKFSHGTTRTDGDGQSYWLADAHGHRGRLGKQTFRVKKGEYIDEVKVTHGLDIEKLQFKTNKGRWSDVDGGKSLYHFYRSTGTETVFTAPKDTMLGGIQGSSNSWYVNELSFVFVPAKVHPR